MKDHIKDIIDKKLFPDDNKNRIREYLQKYLLYVLYKKKIYKNLVFCGGTALRILYKTGRFSEDMDFSLSAGAKGYDFEKLLKIIKDELLSAGYKPEIKYNGTGNVHNAFVKFPDLLFEYDITAHRDEKLAVKIEIDINPPAGGREEVTLYNSVYMFYMLHYDLPSLFAGKVHALLCRKYTKGRDWYDLLWYLTNFKGLEPNVTMLNNALRQTSKELPGFAGNEWKDKLKEVIGRLDINKVRDDVGRFLENRDEMKILSKENLYKLLNI
ncbi:MAG: nucleotidyl transferase AbiEii/AbiGii toxin family protein [Elusimicrobiota bacterium]